MKCPFTRKSKIDPPVRAKLEELGADAELEVLDIADSVAIQGTISLVPCENGHRALTVSHIVVCQVLFLRGKARNLTSKVAMRA